MTGYRPGMYWQYTWRYIGPVIMTAILITSVVSMCLNNPTYSAWNAKEVNNFLNNFFALYCLLNGKYISRLKLNQLHIQIGH